ncbi:Uncharacterised protein [Lysinibacillus sphaericus]|nr:Uncharacterised protein [Lysinibacillus sphaericus]
MDFGLNLLNSLHVTASFGEDESSFKSSSALPINPLTMLNCASFPINSFLLPILRSKVPIPLSIVLIHGLEFPISSDILPIPSARDLAHLETSVALPINPLTMLNCASFPINSFLLPILRSKVPIPLSIVLIHRLELPISPDILPIPSARDLAHLETSVALPIKP